MTSSPKLTQRERPVGAVVQRVAPDRYVCIIPTRAVYATWPTPEQAAFHALRLGHVARTLKIHP